MGNELEIATSIYESIYHSVLNAAQPGGIEWQKDAALGDAQQIFEALAAQAGDPRINLLTEMLKISLEQR